MQRNRYGEATSKDSLAVLACLTKRWLSRIPLGIDRTMAQGQCSWFSRIAFDPEIACAATWYPCAGLITVNGHLYNRLRSSTDFLPVMTISRDIHNKHAIARASPSAPFDTPALWRYSSVPSDHYGDQRAWFHAGWDRVPTCDRSARLAPAPDGDFHFPLQDGVVHERSSHFDSKFELSRCGLFFGVGIFGLLSLQAERAQQKGRGEICRCQYSRLQHDSVLHIFSCHSTISFSMPLHSSSSCILYNLFLQAGDSVPLMATGGQLCQCVTNERQAAHTRSPTSLNMSSSRRAHNAEPHGSSVWITC